ncbi:sodium/hydrogen exchanger 9B2-like [Anopheles cruzii]|uniref:sodium/hydrogen exchanger 9B2-like n=1 Tax=Anopheles cruzii TaxID=68878 RepID=UPI0022EC3034|nr:sodium/hydrogen exchanger 9B2-like [Anopheles cruzii]XP_052870569.1 sodium/hydrogen exchanger 9B2-like [Anopheles cruzii]
MHARTPPRIYITSVEEGSVDGPSTNNGQSSTEIDERDGRSRPIPSIDLAMAFAGKQSQPNRDGAGTIPLTDGTVLRTANLGGMPVTPSTAPSKCPTVQRSWPVTSQPVALLVVFGFLWAIAWSILPAGLSDPTGGLMRLVFLFVGAQTCGELVSLTGLPDMLGMLGWGVLYANVGWADFGGYERLEVFLREMALVNIMLLAGLGLDYAALRSLFRFIMLLTVLPSVAEVAATAILSHYLLKLPWLWGVLLGLVVTAISPNVVVTVLLRLKEERLGLGKGIHTLIIAVTSCNDVLAIFLFGVILGLIFVTGNVTSQIAQGPIGIVIGLGYGSACGLVLLHLPSYHARYSVGLRFTMTALAGTLSVVGSKAIGYPTAGALGCIVTAFVAGTGWRKRPDGGAGEVGVYLDLLWKFLKPVSFSLIGKEVNFSVLAGETVLYGMVTLVVAVLLRLAFSYCSTLGSELNWKERSYVTLSGFPKATVQAALGPAALDLARALGAPKEDYGRAQTVLIVTVLAIIFTAPLGALLMVKLAPRWLKRSVTAEDDRYQ